MLNLAQRNRLALGRSLASALDRAAKERGHRGTDVDVECLVVGAQGIGKVGERLAIVGHSRSADLEGKDTLGLVAVRLLAQGAKNRRILNRGAHRERVVQAGIEDNVVDEDSSNKGALEVVVEGGVTLLTVLAYSWNGDKTRLRVNSQSQE